MASLRWALAPQAKTMAPKRERPLDCTPERLRKGDPSEMVNPARIDSREQPIGLTRRFRVSHFDRLHNAGKIGEAQYVAGNWYREQWERCRFGSSVVSSYGEHSSAVPRTCLLAMTERQVASRKLFHEARQQIPSSMLGFVDRLLLHNNLPPQRMPETQHSLAELGRALDRLANWLNK